MSSLPARAYPTVPPATSSRFPLDDVEARQLVSGLHTPRPSVYWADLLLSAGVGWAGFAVALIAKPFSWPMLAASLISALALYRGLCFLHEISHLRHKALGAFETVWNLLLGVPLLMPSFMYVGVHQDHHKLATYGTSQDPEYLPFSGRPLMIALFTLQSLLLPLFLVVRFVLLAPLGLLAPPIHKWLAVHASAFSMNVQYRREPAPALLRKMMHWEVAALSFWAALLGLAAWGVLPLRVFAIWYGVSAVVSLINALRTLGAHRYGSDGKPLGREGQLGDSLDTPGAFWTELWAPVGLRYHALHHYFPGIPYHNLKSAHLRLSQALPPDSRYRKAASPSLPRSLRWLCRGCKG